MRRKILIVDDEKNTLLGKNEFDPKGFDVVINSSGLGVSQVV